MLWLVCDIIFSPRMYDNYLWNGWAYRTWQALHGNFQRTGRQALKGNITSTNKQIKLVEFYYGLMDPTFSYETIENILYPVMFRKNIYYYDRFLDTFKAYTYTPDGCCLESFNTAIDIDNDGRLEFFDLYTQKEIYDVKRTTDDWAETYRLKTFPSWCCRNAEPVVDRKSGRIFSIICPSLFGLVIFKVEISHGRYTDTLLWSKVNNHRVTYVSLGDFNKDGFYEFVGPYADSIVIYDINGNKLYKINRGVSLLAGVLVDDINNDGELELVIPNDGAYAYRYDGTLLWEFHPNFYQISSAITSADIDYDGITEVIVVADSLYALNGLDGSKKWSAWIGGYPLEGQGAKLADIDPTSPGMEIIVPTWYVNKGLWVFSSDGSLLWSEFEGLKVSGVAVGDIDMDGCSELLVGVNEGGYKLFKIDGQGRNCGSILSVDELISDNDRSVISKDGYIRFNGDYKVYSVDGRLIKEGKGGSVKLPRGVYFYVSGREKGRVVIW